MKHYLNVSYEDRDLAKKLGARWDPSVKRWYCPANSPLAKIFTWRKVAHSAPNKSSKTGLKTSDSVSQEKQMMPQIKKVRHLSKHTVGSQPVKTVKPSQPQNLELFIAA